MKSINVRYFALLRDEAKTDDEDMEVACETYLELYDFLKHKHGFTLSAEMIQVAVNDEFSHMHHQLESNARIVFIPPVAGG